jgi:hypothetical protein
MTIKLIKQLFVIALILTGFGASAQRNSFRDSRGPGNSGQGRKVEAVRESYVGRQLNLTPEEAEKFWPLYRQYHQEITEVRQAKRQNALNGSGSDQVKKDLYYEEKLVEIKRRYTEQFYKILPDYKVSIIQKSERQFTDELIKQLGERPE